MIACVGVLLSSPCPSKFLKLLQLCMIRPRRSTASRKSAAGTVTRGFFGTSDGIVLSSGLSGARASAPILAGIRPQVGYCVSACLVSSRTDGWNVNRNMGVMLSIIALDTRGGRNSVGTAWPGPSVAELLISTMVRSRESGALW